MKSGPQPLCPLNRLRPCWHGLSLLRFSSGGVLLCLNDSKVDARFAGLPFRRFEIKVVLELLRSIVVLTALLQRAGKTEVGVAPPGSDHQDMAQQSNWLRQSLGRAVLLDLRCGENI